MYAYMTYISNIRCAVKTFSTLSGTPSEYHHGLPNKVAIYL